MNQGMLSVGKGRTLDMAWSPFNDNIIATAGEDQNISITTIPDGGIPAEGLSEADVVLSGHEKKISLVRWNPIAQDIMASASYDRTVRTWDVTQEAEIMCFDTPKDNIYSIEWNGNGSLLASTSKDKNCYIFDPRQPEPLAVLAPFDGGKQSKLWWMPDKGLLGCVGFSKTAKRQIRIYDMANLDTPFYKKDLDNNSSVAMPHYDQDTGILYMPAKGDGGITWYETKKDSKRCIHPSQLGFRDTTPQKGGAFIPKRACDTSKCEIGRFMRLTKDSVQPISFITPRKSKQYQADLYPDTASMTPALQAEQWLEGEDVDGPILMSLDPSGDGTPSSGQAAPVRKTRRPYSELLKENEELKAQVAAGGGGGGGGSSEEIETLKKENESLKARVAELEESSGENESLKARIAELEESLAELCS